MSRSQIYMKKKVALKMYKLKLKLKFILKTKQISKLLVINLLWFTIIVIIFQFIGLSCINCDIIFVESICRVSTLSMSGNILYHLKLANKFYVHWNDLVLKYPRCLYLGGRIVWLVLFCKFYTKNYIQVGMFIYSKNI